MALHDPSSQPNVLTRVVFALYQMNGEATPHIVQDTSRGSLALTALTSELEQMSERGDCLATRLLGNACWYLQFFQKDLETAAHYRSKCIGAWSRAVHKMRDAVAQCNLAQVYYNDPVPDAQRLLVVPMLTQSAEQNHAASQFLLATCYHPSSRKGVEHNSIKSKYWCERAADNYDPDALALGHKYGLLTS